MRGLEFLLARSVQVLFIMGLLLLLFSLGLLVYSAWRYVDRIDPVQEHLQYIHRIENAEGNTRDRLLSIRKSGREYLTGAEVEQLKLQLQSLNSSNSFLAGTTPEILMTAIATLETYQGLNHLPLEESLSAMRRALHQELMAHQDMVSSFQAEAQRGLRIASGLAFGLLVISALLWAMIRQRILTPLNKLASQMTLLARRNFSELSVEDTDPMLYPMIERYNHMTQRLRKLEEIQLKRQQSLTEEVRNATFLVLQQQRRLAQSERLGAVGEVAAGVAHELKNPLTSVQMGLDNLRLDMPDGELSERIELINNEVKRVTRQLSQLLNEVKQKPEKPRMIDLGEELEKLVSLAVYQLHEDIAVHYQANEKIVCLLPRSGLWQALLNLILNAGQIMDDKGGDIIVETKCIDDKVQITVSDTGPGFPDEILEAGLQAFRSWRAGGTGLGLTMVRRFVNDLGGKLMIENREEGGARVTMLLPCNKKNG